MTRTWTDFLALDRPLGFVLSDFESYSTGSRGLNVDDVRALLPGPALYTPDNCERFVVDALADLPEMKELRRSSAERIGLAEPGAAGAASSLLAELRRRALLHEDEPGAR